MCILPYDYDMRIAEIRKAKGMTQVDLAAAVGVEQPTISRLEKGSGGSTLRLIREVADVLDVSVADLFLDEREAQEIALVRAFRGLSPERQAGWLDLANSVLQK